MTPANLSGESSGKGTTPGRLTAAASLSGTSTGSGTTSGQLTAGAIVKAIPVIVNLDEPTVERLLSRLERWHGQPSENSAALQREVEEEAGADLWDKLVHIVGHPASQGIAAWVSVIIAVLSFIVALRALNDQAVREDVAREIAEQAIRDAREVERKLRDEAALERQRERAKRFAQEFQRSRFKHAQRKCPPSDALTNSRDGSPRR